MLLKVSFERCCWTVCLVLMCKDLILTDADSPRENVKKRVKGTVIFTFPSPQNAEDLVIKMLLKC